MLKSFKFQLLPTKEQEVLLSKHFGCRRFVWNYFLNRRKDEYINNKQNLTYNKCAKELTLLKQKNDYNWLNEVNSQSLQHSLKDLDGAYNKFFRKEANFPKFKSKYHKQSFRVPQFNKIENNKLYFPKFKEGIKINVHREFGEIKFVTISKTPTGKYFASLTCEVEQPTKFKQNTNTLGIDLGVKDFATDNNNIKYSNPKHYQQLQTKLKFNQKQLSKKQKGSKSRNKQRHKVAIIHEIITNQRKDFLHKLSTKLLHENQVICIEDLAVKELMSDNKYVGSCGWSEFVRQLQYKAEWYGRSIVKIDRYFPSSKMCNSCGWINESLNLNDREWLCTSCNTLRDREHNAALNIHKQGLNIMSGLGTKSDTKQKQVEASTLVESTKPETTKSLV